MSSECLNNFLLQRNQYLETRDFVITDYKLSSYSVPVVGDEILYGIPDFRGVYSKGLTGHTGGGLDGPLGPNPIIYQKLVDSIRLKNLEGVNSFADPSSGVLNYAPRLVDPYSLFDVEYEGLYRASFNIPLAPSPLSLQTQAEMLEVYSMALIRDFNLLLLDPSDNRYDSFTDPINGTNPGSWNYSKNYVQGNVINNLNLFNNTPPFSNYLQAPVDESSGSITPGLLYRGTTTGDKQGPYISQMFFYSVFPGNLYINQNYLVLDFSFNTIDLSRNFNFTKPTFLNIWNGGSSITSGNFTLRYLSTIRDLAIYINKDEVWQAFFIAATFCLDRGINRGFFTKSRKPGTSRFIDLGSVDLYAMMIKAMKQAMNAAWVWKWSQLRLRPEEFAYQTQLSMNGYPFGLTAGYLNNPILTDISNNTNGNGVLMPVAYSAGSPGHPAYPGGHATIAGAMTTILKAWFNCDSLIEAYVPDVSSGLFGGYNLLSGTKLEVYKQKSLSDPSGVTGYFRLDDELDKMASNCSYSRNMAGIHYRSDEDAGLQIGENVAIAVLQQEVFKYEDDVCFRFKKRDGTIIDISNNSNPVPGATGTYYFSAIGVTGQNIYFSTPSLIAPSRDKQLNIVLQVAPSTFYGSTGILGPLPDPTSNGAQSNFLPVVFVP
jgi:hypothetical protein